MPWPETVILQFQAIPPNPGETDFQGPYNKLLHYLFPAETPFTVVPLAQYSIDELVPDWILAFEVLFFDKPVFVLELKKSAAMRYISYREQADKQIRARIGDLAERCPMPTLHAVSVIGTRLCFYRCDTVEKGRMIRPRAIRNPQHSTCGVDDTAPVTQWDCDILDADGEARLRAVVDEIKRACTGLA